MLIFGTMDCPLPEPTEQHQYTIWILLEYHIAENDLPCWLAELRSRATGQFFGKARLKTANRGDASA
ncbi:hypothetical protein [Pelagibacterium lacus]|uniref:hypothetical protein n=1 Tax=Pelagibacterium lacus TaxID=2282655 RepID=UPI000E09C7AD|nr:hypothetical protein [Pelagibacterium lacus]